MYIYMENRKGGIRGARRKGRYMENAVNRVTLSPDGGALTSEA
jgi:hypothetical protein